MKKLEVRFTRQPGEEQRVGQLAEDRRRLYFEYDAEFLATGLNLSPFRIPFEAGLFEHTDRGFGPLPGLFDDSLPDGWGLLLMDRDLQTRRWDPAGVSVLDRLAWVGTHTMGALTYHPPVERAGGDSTVFELHDLARDAQAVLSGTARTVLPQLVRAGGSPGGARPKVLVGFDPGTGEIRSGEVDLPPGFEHWLVKFAAKGDGPDAGAVEYAYALMAGNAGIDMAPTRLFETAEGDRFFGARRFDRASPTEGQGRTPTNRRVHVHTFGNLIQANFRLPSNDYADLLKVTSLLTRNHEEVRRAFRRLVFNVAAHNRDDHVKNFAFCLSDECGEWSMSPAYDVCPASGPGGEHTMTVAGEGRQPGLRHLHQLAAGVSLSPGEADAIIGEVVAAVSNWTEHADAAGVSPAERDRIGKRMIRLV
jgi:serine/threonine-protein kinase HipA